MKTPIFDFVAEYKDSGALRLHMPGHKGIGVPESCDITEIEGADSLFEAGGIIRESEMNAGEIFGANTFYSAEGSSLSIRAMLYIISVYSGIDGKRVKILAGRNAHKSFVSGAALLGIDIEWLYPERFDSYLSCPVSAEDISAYFATCDGLPAAVYLTSPDYLGNTVDIRNIAKVCHEHGVLLLVDNAHGAYLRFLPKSSHPIDLGADMCCDSAHKTLPVITGGAYLHISRGAPSLFAEIAKTALSLFGSTSPSYLILASLDKANAYLTDGYREKLSGFVALVDATKDRLSKAGYVLIGNEPLKITIFGKPYGYTGKQIAKLLLDSGIVAEFSDPDFLVLMLTPEIGKQNLERLETALLAIPRRDKICQPAPRFARPVAVTSPREAMLSPSEAIPAQDCLGRTLAAITVGCPPAVPVLVSGERIDKESLECFEYYGIEVLRVVK